MGSAFEKGMHIFKDLSGFDVISGFTDKSFPGINVREDVTRISLSLDFTYRHLFYLNQIHSNCVVCPTQGKEVFQGDGLITNEKDTVLVVRTADCLPVFFYDTKNKIISLVHLGWKPAKAGILDKFLEKAQNLFSIDKDSTFVGIGPGLRKCCYEVGVEFLDYQCFRGFITQKNAKYFLDIVEFLKQNFIEKGLKEENFLDCGICSMCSRDVYSLRRDNTERRTVNFIIRV